MRNTLLLSLGLFTFPLLALGAPCKENTVLRMMAERKIIDLKDPSVCVDFKDFSKIKVKMQDTNYKLNENRAQGKPTPQDEAVKKIVKTLSGASEDKPIVVTRGIADGTFNNAPSASDEASIKKENAFLLTITDNNVLSKTKIEKTIGQYDKNASTEIIKELSKYSGMPFNKIPDDSRLKSLIRNSLLAKSRGDFLCNQIFADPNACQTQGEISPSLDQGKHNFEGCCDGRRGAVIEVQSTVNNLKGKGSDGTFQPSFGRPDGNLQGKMQIAASMSVFSLPIKEDLELEKKIIEEGAFVTSSAYPEHLKESQELLEKDRARFREAMAGTGCANNDFAVDAARRIYWNIKSQKDLVDPELYQAVMKNDFKKVYSLIDGVREREKKQDEIDKKTYARSSYSSRSKTDDSILIDMLSTGSNNSAVKLPELNCKTPTRFFVMDLVNKHNENCTLYSEPGSPLSQFKTIGQMAKSDFIKKFKTKDLNNPTFQIIGDMDPSSKGNFYFYDVAKKKSYFMSFDPTCNNPSEVQYYPDRKEEWHTTQTASSKERFTLPCIQKQSRVQPPRRLNSDFYINAPMSTSTPTDVFNCLDASQAIDHEMAASSERVVPLNRKAGVGLWEIKGDNETSLVLNTDKVNHNHPADISCHACRSGTKLDPDISYTPRQSAVINDGGKSTEGAKATFNDAHSKVDTNPLTVSSLKHFRSYVIPECGPKDDPCKCLTEGNIKSKLLEKNVEIIDFSAIKGKNKKAAIKYKDGNNGKFACVFTPPVPETCSYNPYGIGTTATDRKPPEPEICPLEVTLSKLPKTASVTDSDIELYKKVCGENNFPQSEVSCLKKDQGRMCVDMKGGPVNKSKSESHNSKAQ